MWKCWGRGSVGTGDVVTEVVEVEEAPYSHAPIRLRGQDLVAIAVAFFAALVCAALGALGIAWERTVEPVLFFTASALLVGVPVICWLSHLSLIRHAAKKFDGERYLILGARSWPAGTEPRAGKRIRRGFVHLGAGSFEIRTGRRARLVAAYGTGDLERVTVLRMLGGVMNPLARLTFTDGTIYDVAFSHAGPKGMLPVEQRYVEAFVAAVRTALGPAGAPRVA